MQPLTHRFSLNRPVNTGTSPMISTKHVFCQEKLGTPLLSYEKSKQSIQGERAAEG